MKRKKNETLPITCRECAIRATPHDMFRGRFYVAYINPKKKVLGVRCAGCGTRFIEIDLCDKAIKDIVTRLLNEDEAVKQALKIINNIDDEE